MPPSPPDVRDLATFARRRQASRESSRYDLTNRVFNAALPFFGRKAKMPLVYFRSHTPGGQIDMRGEPAMNTAEAYAKFDAPPSGLVAYPTGLDPWLSPRAPWRGLPEPVKRQHFIDILLHELAHTQQREDTFRLQPRHMLIEGGADAFTALARDRVVRRMGLGNQAAMPFVGGYGQLGNRYIRRFGGNQALYGQFGRKAPPFQFGQR